MMTMIQCMVVQKHWAFFHSIKISGTFRNAGKWYENFLEKFSNLRETFKRKFWKFREKNNIKQKFLVRNFQNFGYTFRGCLLFRKFRQMLFHSTQGICGNFKTGIFGRIESAYKGCHLSAESAAHSNDLLHNS